MDEGGEVIVATRKGHSHPSDTGDSVENVVKAARWKHNNYKKEFPWRTTFRSIDIARSYLISQGFLEEKRLKWKRYDVIAWIDTVRDERIDEETGEETEGFYYIMISYAKE